MPATEIVFSSRPRLHMLADGGMLVYRGSGELHSDMTLIYRRLTRFIKPASAKQYVRHALHFEDYLMSIGLCWNSPPQPLRQAGRQYLAAHGARLTERSDHWRAEPDPDQVGPPNLRLVIESLRAVYTAARHLGLYEYEDEPFRLTITSAESGDGLPAPLPPSWSGLTLPRPKLSNPDRYFVFKGGYWTPKFLMDAADLYEQVRAAFAEAPLRDQVIVRCLFEGGPRISEICSLTFRGWDYSVGEKRPAFGPSFKLPSKGKHGSAIKPVHVGSETGSLLRRYFMTERRLQDPLTEAYEAWARALGIEDYTPEHYRLFLSASGRPSARVPVFLTRGGRDYTANAHRKGAWRPRMATAGLQVRPHQARHWFVSMYLQAVELLFERDAPQYRKNREALGLYMGWAYPEDMLAVYDRTLDEHRTYERVMDITTQLQELLTQNIFPLLQPPTVPPPKSGEMTRRLLALQKEGSS
ncbi:hypothetical protein GCM10008949_43980 [Deinococcus humi]|nr:hypothetical protein GCM10008949_43980 [Deinococcus humi]